MDGKLDCRTAQKCAEYPSLCLYLGTKILLQRSNNFTLSEVGILTINGKSGTVKDRLEMGYRLTLIPIIGGG